MPGTGHFGKFGTTWIPVPQVPVQTFISVPDTSGNFCIMSMPGTGHFGKSGTTSTPAPDTLVSPYHMDTGTAGTGTYFHTRTRHLCNFGTASMPGIVHIDNFGTTPRPAPTLR